MNDTIPSEWTFVPTGTATMTEWSSGQAFCPYSTDYCWDGNCPLGDASWTLSRESQSTIGYTNVRLTYSMSMEGKGGDDDCYIEYMTDGITWQILHQLESDTSGKTGTFGAWVGTSADNNHDVRIRLRSSTDGGDISCYYNEFTLTGDPLPTVAPTTGAIPTIYPTMNPTIYPTLYPTIYPTINPTIYPTIHLAIYPTTNQLNVDVTNWEIYIITCIMGSIVIIIIIILSCFCWKKKYIQTNKQIVSDTRELAKLRQSNQENNESGVGILYKAGYRVTSRNIVDTMRKNTALTDEQIIQPNLESEEENEDGTDKTSEVEDWLYLVVKLPQYYDIFIQNGFHSLEMITEINKIEYLSYIGVNIKAHQIKLMNHIEMLQNNVNSNDGEM